MNLIIKSPTDGKLIGYNTDYVGAISSIEDGLRGLYYIYWLIIPCLHCFVMVFFDYDLNSNYFLAGKAHSKTADSPLAGRLFIVIGAGGAGKALAYGAKEKGARVVIANRTYGNLPNL